MRKVWSYHCPGRAEITQKAPEHEFPALCRGTTARAGATPHRHVREVKIRPQVITVSSKDKVGANGRVCMTSTRGHFTHVPPPASSRWWHLCPQTERGFLGFGNPDELLHSKPGQDPTETVQAPRTDWGFAESSAG